MLDAHQLLWTQIAAGVCTANFIGLMVRLFRSRGQTKAAGKWDKVEGVIIASEIDQPPSHASDDASDASPVIRYSYRANGRDLESDRVRIGGASMTTRMLAIRQIARYPLGAQVDVYVNPKKPEHAVLEPRAQGNIAGVIAFTVAFGCAAAILTAHAVAGRVLYTGNGVPLFAFVLPAAAILVAVLGIMSFVRAQRLAGASTRWPSIIGTVTKSDVVEEQIDDDSSDNDSIRRKIRRYQIDLRYAYRVGQRDYVGTSDVWGWTPIYGLREQAETTASRYKPGEQVTVYYDPEQPGNAVLEPNNRQGSYAPLIFSAIFAVAGAAMLMFFIKVGFDH